MANLTRSLKIRIQATKKTSQITKAMHMVSASKLKGAEKHLKDFRPFIKKVEEIIVNLINSKEDFNHFLFEKKEVKKVCLVLVTSDRGLAGSYNANIFKEFRNRLESIKKDNLEFCVLPLGQKAFAYAKRWNYPIIADEVVNLRDDIEFYHLNQVIRFLVLKYWMKEFDQVEILSTSYLNPLMQSVKTKVILPLSNYIDTSISNSTIYEFDGGAKEVIDQLAPIYVENVIYGVVLDAKTSEHASRMNAMKKATDNAMEIVDKLELMYNRARQSAITTELTDIIGGASVINQE